MTSSVDLLGAPLNPPDAHRTKMDSPKKECPIESAVKQIEITLLKKDSTRDRTWKRASGDHGRSAREARVQLEHIQQRTAELLDTQEELREPEHELTGIHPSAPSESSDKKVQDIRRVSLQVTNGIRTKKKRTKKITRQEDSGGRLQRHWDKCKTQEKRKERSHRIGIKYGWESNE